MSLDSGFHVMCARKKGGGKKYPPPLPCTASWRLGKASSCVVFLSNVTGIPPNQRFPLPSLEKYTVNTPKERSFEKLLKTPGVGLLKKKDSSLSGKSSSKTAMVPSSSLWPRGLFMAMGKKDDTPCWSSLEETLSTKEKGMPHFRSRNRSKKHAGFFPPPFAG